MRMLFTFAGGSGHLEPLVPIARAARAAGHVVAFAGWPWMVPKVEAAGFPAFATGSDAGLTPNRLPLRELDEEREAWALRDGFARRNARERATDVLALCDTWQPELIVWEETDFGAGIAAEKLGLPHATVLVIAAGSFLRSDLIAGPLNELIPQFESASGYKVAVQFDATPNLIKLATSGAPFDLSQNILHSLRRWKCRSNEVVLNFIVLAPTQENSVGFVYCSSGAAHLLIVGDHGTGSLEVNYKTQIRFIETHSERHGRD